MSKFKEKKYDAKDLIGDIKNNRSFVLGMNGRFIETTLTFDKPTRKPRVKKQSFNETMSNVAFYYLAKAVDKESVKLKKMLGWIEKKK